MSKHLRKAPLLAFVAFALVFFVVPAVAVTYTITVQTDAASYSGTQPITVSGVVSPAPGPSTGVVIVVKGPSGAVVDINSVPADPNTGAYSSVTRPGGTGNWTTGTYNVNATWGGPGGSATMTTTFAYVKPLVNTTTSLSCASPIAVGATSACTATVIGAQGSVAGETITFSNQPGGSGSVTLPSTPTCSISSAASCSLNVTGATAGSATVKASYPGDSNNAASSGTGSVTVTATTTTSSSSTSSTSSTTTSTSSTTSSTSSTTSSSTTVTTVTQTVVVSSPTSSSTSTTTSSSSSSGGGLGSLTYVIVAAVIVILAAVGLVMWRRSVAKNYGQPATTKL